MADLKCAACDKIIVGKISLAVKKYYHPECLLCCKCKQNIGDNFVEHEQKVFCTDCYNKRVYRVCASCEGPIRGNQLMIELLGKRWHQHCITCDECKMPVDEDDCYVRDNKVFCGFHIGKEVPPICSKCLKGVVNEKVMADGFFWHPRCFVCEVCARSLREVTYFVREDEHKIKRKYLYCQTDYAKLTGQTRLRCKKCKIMLTTANLHGTFEDPYCKTCFQKLNQTPPPKPILPDAELLQFPNAQPQASINGSASTQTYGNSQTISFAAASSSDKACVPASKLLNRSLKAARSVKLQNNTNQLNPEPITPSSKPTKKEPSNSTSNQKRRSKNRSRKETRSGTKARKNKTASRLEL